MPDPLLVIRFHPTKDTAKLEGGEYFPLPPTYFRQPGAAELGRLLELMVNFPLEQLLSV